MAGSKESPVDKARSPTNQTRQMPTLPLKIFSERLV
jgi:hypothetical protein